MTKPADAEESKKPTRVNRRTAPRATRQPESVITTAEIPRVAPTPSPQFPRTADGWHPDIERRLPAPWALQLAVWVLFVLFIVGLVGLAVEHFHPSWIGFLRNTASTPHQRTGHGTTTSTNPSSTSSSTTRPATRIGKLTLVSATKSDITYSVPTSTGFSIVVSTSNACYTLVKSPPGSAHYLFAATITPKQSPEAIKLVGPASVVLDNHVSGLDIKVGSTSIGSITAPQPFITYTFLPTRH